MPIPILKIGTSQFAFKKVSDATRCLDLLSQAVLMQSEYRSGSGYVYTPEAHEDTERLRGALELSMVPDKQVEAPMKRAPKSRQLPPPSPTGLEGIQ